MPVAAWMQDWPASGMPASEMKPDDVDRPGGASQAAVIQSSTYTQGTALQINGPPSSPDSAIRIQGQRQRTWKHGAYQAQELKQVTIQQGDTTYQADQAVIWLDDHAPRGLSPGAAVASLSLEQDLTSPITRRIAILYLEGNVAIDFRRPASHRGTSGGPEFDSIRDQRWLGTLASDLPIQDVTSLDRAGASSDAKKALQAGLTPEPKAAAITNAADDPDNQRPRDGLPQRALAYWQLQTREQDAAIQQIAFQTNGSGGAMVGGQVPDTRFVPNAFAPAALGNPILNSQSQGAATLDPNRGAELNPGLGSAFGSSTGSQATAQFGALPGQTGPAFSATPGIDPGRAPAVFGLQAPGQGSGILAPGQTLPTGSRPAGDAVNVKIYSRTTGVDLNVRNVPGRVPGEQVILGTGGIRVEVDSQAIAESNLAGSVPGERLVIQADNLVAWTNQIAALGGSDQAPRWELFLEGNVIFALGQRVVYANKMYYDVNQQMGTILDAEMLSPVPQYEGLVRLRADVLQQINRQQFRAYGAAVTTSRIGVPRYFLESREIDLTRSQTYAIDPQTGAAAFDPQTQAPAINDQFTVESYDNFIRVLGRPIFYWPLFKTDLDNPQFYLEGLSVKNDNIFGFQVLSDFNLYQLLGQTPIEGTNWSGSLDYLSERGLGLGSRFTYDRPNGFFFAGPTTGFYDSWFLLEEQGLDNLGMDRRRVTPEEEQRGRSIARHDHRFLNGDRLLGEFGWISDRNFLEQYYEREWDEQKDAATRLSYQRLRENRFWEITGAGNVNDFFTETQWLPRADFTILAQPVFGSAVTWHAHSHIGYADLKVADAPTNAVDAAKFDLLAWEAEREGLRAGTRQELELPVQAGPVKLVPYLLGDATFWGEDLNAEDVTRLYGQAGIRATLPFWRVEPGVQSELLNLNGLAHKINFETDFLYADANQDLERFPLYDPLDDNAQEHFRRRFAFDTFGIAPGGDVPLPFDERFFALRSGIQRYVSSPVSEIADDLMIFKFGVNQRWQTKRGTPGRQRIIDWITLDVAAHYFPKSERDNFGADFGMIDYDFRWHIGDRLALLSDGYFDTFENGLQTASVGLAANRPGVGDVYLGLRNIDGPIDSQTVNARVNYRMSPNWILRASTSYDFGNTGRIGQTLGTTYIGESFLWYVGSNSDFSRDNVGFVFSIEPRGLPGGRQSRLGGVAIPPPGVLGLE